MTKELLAVLVGVAFELPVIMECAAQLEHPTEPRQGRLIR